MPTPEESARKESLWKEAIARNREKAAQAVGELLDQHAESAEEKNALYPSLCRVLESQTSLYGLDAGPWGLEKMVLNALYRRRRQEYYQQRDAGANRERRG